MRNLSRPIVGSMAWRRSLRPCAASNRYKLGECLPKQSPPKQAELICRESPGSRLQPDPPDADSDRSPAYARGGGASGASAGSGKSYTRKLRGTGALESRASAGPMSGDFRAAARIRIRAAELGHSIPGRLPVHSVSLFWQGIRMVRTSVQEPHRCPCGRPCRTQASFTDKSPVVRGKGVRWEHGSAAERPRGEDGRCRSSCCLPGRSKKFTARGVPHLSARDLRVHLRPVCFADRRVLLALTDAPFLGSYCSSSHSVAFYRTPSGQQCFV